VLFHIRHMEKCWTGTFLRPRYFALSVLEAFDFFGGSCKTVRQRDD